MKKLLTVAALLISTLCARAAELPLEGTWRWTFAMPDGSTVTPTLRLDVEAGRLTGTCSFRAGSELPITNAVYSANTLRFQVVRSRDEQTFTTTYNARLAGKSLVGQIESDWAGQPQRYDWRAEKIEGPNGVWRWDVAAGERTLQAQLTLKQNGSKLEGTLLTRRGSRPLRLQRGTIDDDGQLSFQVEVGPESSRRVLRYKGLLVNDTITGTLETTFNGVTKETEWQARRSTN